MRLLVLGLLLIFSSSLFAKRDIDMKVFNQLMIENIDKTLKNNPQVYEKNDPVLRKPASVVPEDQKKLEEQSEKLEGFQDQMSQGGDQW